MLGRIGPGVIAYPAAVGETGALLGDLQRSFLCLGEDRRIPPCSDQAEPHEAFPGVLGVFGVHVGAPGAAVYLARTDLDELLRRRWQSRAGYDCPDGVEGLNELCRDRVAVEVEPGFHRDLLAARRVIPH